MAGAMNVRQKLAKGRPLKGHSNTGATVTITVVPAGNPEVGTPKDGFEATAIDPEQGDISNQIVWKQLGEGNPIVGTGTPASLTFVNSGAGTLRAQVTDSFGVTTFDDTAITVDP